jgi:hypothetical protein
MTKNIKKVLFVTTLGFLAVFENLYAQEGGFITGSIKNPISSNTFEEFLDNLLRAVTNVGGVVVTLAIIYSGFLFVTAQGNEAKLGKAKDALLWSLIGAAILLGAWVISKAILGTVKQL